MYWITHIGIVLVFWRADYSAMEYNVIYDVNVQNVLVDGKAEDYTYWFKVDDQSSEQHLSGESSNEI
ncbi:hypothetical protein [Acinetobacter johnsonii]|uniref:hypothetical protein n=1 Tax=Acinetobacter johnsonii TaxID=40214 RepID=UPI0032B5F11A